jgi:hypothetical protein
MEEEFKKFLKEIPEGVVTPLENEKSDDPVEEGRKIIDALEVIGAEEKIKLMPRIKEAITDLKDLQNKNIRVNDESVRNTLMPLISAKEKIEHMIN